MIKEDKKNELIRIRNKLSEIFNASKEDWKDSWYTHSLCEAMSNIDTTIQRLDSSKPKGLKAL